MILLKLLAPRLTSSITLPDFRSSLISKDSGDITDFFAPTFKIAAVEMLNSNRLPKFHHNRNCQITTGRAIVKPQARSCKM
ncbi:hypothetical protein PSHT_10376 [Puccinia striiformis]|uniref:Uncharacterized protein n=1 Tax=Puccinia striiformis TaxID=27350 RepID=A0A2S4VA52_9BASI|nr:hypothetical protein PSHT_10376 [Puccinia striiformis]